MIIICLWYIVGIYTVNACLCFCFRKKSTLTFVLFVLFSQFLAIIAFYSHAHIADTASPLITDLET